MIGMYNNIAADCALAVARKKETYRCEGKLSYHYNNQNRNISLLDVCLHSSNNRLCKLGQD